MYSLILHSSFPQISPECTPPGEPNRKHKARELEDVIHTGSGKAQFGEGLESGYGVDLEEQMEGF